MIRLCLKQRLILNLHEKVNQALLQVTKETLIVREECHIYYFTKS